MPQGSVCSSRMDLQPAVQLLALGEQIVQFHFAQNRAQRGLRQLLDGVAIILQFHERLLRADHAEINNGIHLQRNVIAGNDVLRGHIPGHHAQGNPHQLIDRPEDEDQSRPFITALKPSQAEDHRPLIFPQHVQTR